MTKIATHIALGIVVKQGKVLVIERQQREIGRSGRAIVWAFPGGKIETGETAAEAAVREVYEETGCKVKAIETIHEEDHSESPVHVHYIGCMLLGESAHKVTPATIVATDWVPARSLHTLLAWPVSPQVDAYIQAQLLH